MFKVKGGSKEAEIEFDGPGKLSGTIGENPFHLDSVEISPNNFHVISNHKGYRVEVISLDAEKKEVVLKVNGKMFTYGVQDEYDLLLKRMGLQDLAAAKVAEIKAPMPGMVIDVLVKDGQKVSKGDSLLILEAMKMENVIKAPEDGVVKAVKVEKQNPVEKNQVLISLK